jgi:mRNA-degrading endonuclease RelE of RelBE toxin-antitoxin system
MFNLVFTKKALKEIENLDRNVSLRVLDKLKWLADR